MISKPSKSSRKREFLALQALGEQLIGLTRDQLHSIGLPEALLDAVLDAKSMSAHGAMRRQKQLIGKLMRNVDAETIRIAIDSFGRNDRLEKQVFRDAEQWRERITTGNRDDLDAFFNFSEQPNALLATAVGEWFATSDDKKRRLIRRRIFREIHNDLAAKMQEGSPCI